ncbi:helix-turn-helix domain-containing protein [Streptomyces sp. V3I7]|uniref:helix-turn-helix domain-containing protein n=1 Tax=Streptomyces sp. V3I7 TaxID=3042278 RepID=UPI0027815A44|nr:AraC family transcriptional regulator of arabinose operon [Streptomyces sp. V3I7]
MTAAGLPGTAAARGAPSPPPGVVVVGRFDRPMGYSVNRPGGSASWLFTWTTGGRGMLRQGAAGTYAEPGDLVVLAPGVRHRYAVAPGARNWRFWWVHCQARPTWTAWLRPYAVQDGMYVVTRTLHAPGARVDAAFGRMLADARRRGGGAPPADDEVDDEPVAVADAGAARELALCALEEVVLLTAARGREPSSAPGVDARVRRTEELIAADPGAPHTVTSLARSVALSPSRFAHLFARQTGRSPMRALREARLRHAALLLESTDLTVERVAAASGFAGPSHFHRVFRECYGTPPGAYRSGRSGS